MLNEYRESLSDNLVSYQLRRDLFLACEGVLKAQSPENMHELLKEFLKSKRSSVEEFLKTKNTFDSKSVGVSTTEAIYLLLTLLEKELSSQDQNYIFQTVMELVKEQGKVTTNFEKTAF